ncbi:MAG: InlB B-repeat-containing protein, partial [Bacilli bacterium]|nr:InlB B-repeat-containing protein [Bacilli bacterium]
SIGVNHIAIEKPLTVYAAATKSTLTFTSACGGSGTADDGAVWTVTSDASKSTYDATKGIHYGTSKAPVSYLTLSTDDILGTITRIVVNASGASSTAAKLNVTVGGNAFGSQQSLTSTATDYALDGSASGDIVVTISQTSTKKAVYCKSIVVTYDPSTTKGVTYDGNGNTSGSVPTDSNEYDVGDSVTVKGNTGSLKKTQYIFSGWNTAADGSGTGYAPGATFEISANTTLYAQWAADNVDHITVTGSFSKTDYKEGQNWDPSGLTVNAYYEDNTTLPVNVTDDPSLTWSYSPSKANDTSVTSVTATANFGGKSASSEAQTVTVAEDNTVVYLTSDALNRETTGVSGTSYSDWSGKTVNTSASFTGNSAGGNDSIQLRSKDDSGIITTASGGTVRKVSVVWDSNTADDRTLNVYGKNSAYSATSNLYDENSGDLLGTIVKGTSTELTIDGDYPYIGLRSNSGAMYLSSVSVAWESTAEDSAVSAINSFIETYMHLDYTKDENLCATWYSAAKSAYEGIENSAAKLIFATSNSKYKKVDLTEGHIKDGDPDSITYTYADVRERLTNWAYYAADEVITFDPADGSIDVSSARSIPDRAIAMADESSLPLMVTTVTVGAVVAGGLFVLARKRKEE